MAKYILPSNVEAERSVLGSMLMSVDAASVAIASLTRDSFSGVDPRNVVIFKAMEELNAHEVTIDAQSVTNELLNLKLLDAAGGPEYLLELLSSAINPDSVEHYIKIVQDQKVLRSYLLQLEQIQEDFGRGNVTDIGDFLATSQQTLNGIANQRSVGTFLHSKDVALAVQQQILLESKRSNNKLTGVETGFTRLNDFTHGWQKGDLIVLAARPSVGKTALGLNFAINAASTRERPTVAIFSGEMSSSLIMKRMLSSLSMVPLEALNIGQIGPKESAKIASAVTEMSNLNIYIDDKPNPKLGDIVAKSMRLKNNNPDLALIVIDYINIIKTEKKIESRAQEIGEITKTLKELGRNLNVPIIALAQINRDADKNENGVPALSNLKESGSIEQDADIVMLLYRKDYYDGQGKRIVKGGNSFEQKAEMQVNQAKASGKGDLSISSTSINVAKNRNGKTGIVTLLFQKAFQKFENLSLETENEANRITNGEDSSPLDFDD